MRTLPGTQEPEDVARAIIDDGILAQAQEVYTLAAHKDLIRAHLATLVPQHVKGRKTATAKPVAARRPSLGDLMRGRRGSKAKGTNAA